MSDEVWADSQSVAAVPATETIQDTSALISSAQCSLREIDTQPTGRDQVAQVVIWLRELPTDSASAAEAVAALVHQYAQWMREGGVVSDKLWFQVAEIGAWLAIHGHAAALRAFQSTSLHPTSVPQKEAFCDRHRQVSFTVQLYDALCGAVGTQPSPETASLVIDVFVAWLARVMDDYEFVFLHHVAQPLAEHIQQTHRVLPDPLALAAQAFVKSRIAKNWQHEASSIAVPAVLLSASAQATAIHSLQALVVQTLQSQEVFPHVHHPAAILAIALQAAPLATVSSPLIHQFILLRVIHLALVSSRLVIRDDECKRLSERYQEALYRSRLSDGDVDACLRTMEASTNEIQTAMDANPVVYSAILKTMHARSEQELFRPSLITLLEERAHHSVSGSETEAFPAEPFLAKYYDAITIGVQALSQSPASQVVVRCFAVLCHLEFARECCATPQRNGAMLRLTHQVEELIESTPDGTLSAIAKSVLSPQRSSPHEDVMVGWAYLAVGLIVQRKLRILLFQVSDATRRDAFAVVFAGLYHGLEPVDAFAHRFLGFALASLGQFISIYEIFPFYLQETLARFPSDVPQPQAASALGTVFGALYYTPASQAVTEQEKKVEATATETRHAMILWALRQTGQRTKTLLDDGATSDGLYLAELFLEVAKMAPVDLLPAVAREMEALIHHSSGMSDTILHAVLMRVFNAVSVNCEAEKRAWFAAWFLELSAAYPTSAVPSVKEDKDAVVDDVVTAGNKASPAQAVSRL